ncbi:MAG TPA: hypothetical protein VFB38_25705 [Chthonomonadaceae bacterium]|nr:hypothetical protein [Chthonomonadaceae bacterium]
MALSLLLDEHMSPDVAAQIQTKRPEIPVTSVLLWRNGALRGQPEETVLRTAAQEALTLVSYDVSTITPVLVAWGSVGEEHSGVIFIDELTIFQGDIGGQVAALIEHWEATHTWEWKNRVMFLRATRRE